MLALGQRQREEDLGGVDVEYDVVDQQRGRHDEVQQHVARAARVRVEARVVHHGEEYRGSKHHEREGGRVGSHVSYLVQIEDVDHRHVGEPEQQLDNRGEDQARGCGERGVRGLVDEPAVVASHAEREQQERQQGYVGDYVRRSLGPLYEARNERRRGVRDPPQIVDRAGRAARENRVEAVGRHEEYGSEERGVHPLRDFGHTVTQRLQHAYYYAGMQRDGRLDGVGGQ